MSIGQEEDDRAFENWLRAFYAEHPRFPDRLADKLRSKWLMHHAFEAGMKRGEEKSGAARSAMPDPSASCLSDEQHAVFVTAISALGGDWDNAFEAYFKDEEEERHAELMFLAGWVGAVEAQQAVLLLPNATQAGREG